MVLKIVICKNSQSFVILRITVLARVEHTSILRKGSAKVVFELLVSRAAFCPVSLDLEHCKAGEWFGL